MDENDELLVFVTIWDCRTHVPMTSSVERTDLDFKISVALVLTVGVPESIHSISSEVEAAVVVAAAVAVAAVLLLKDNSGN